MRWHAHTQGDCHLARAGEGATWFSGEIDKGSFDLQLLISFPINVSLFLVLKSRALYHLSEKKPGTETMVW